MSESYPDQARRAAEELRQAIETIRPEEVAAFEKTLAGATRIFLIGAGRTGLVARAFAMRLMQIGIETHVAGEATCPAVGMGDLVVALSGSGATQTVNVMLKQAKKAGATILLLCGVEKSPASALADQVCILSKSAKENAAESVLPLGSLFEEAAMLFLDLQAARLMQQKGVTSKILQTRHANLE